MRADDGTPEVTVVVAPDEFGGTLTAAAAARAIAEGWARTRPADHVVLRPQSDGGTGFLAVLEEADVIVGHSMTVSGPLGGDVSAVIGLGDDDTAYLEVAQACGLQLLGGRPTPESAWNATSRGVGDLIVGALRAQPKRIVVGLGGSATTDGGMGIVEVFGGLDAAREALAGIDLVIASDVDNPLLGPTGAARVFGAQKGADVATTNRLELRLQEWADTLASAGTDVRAMAGAGAAGGIGAFLLALGGRRRPGADIVAEATGRAAALAGADLIITGEGSYDAQTAHGKVIAGIAAQAHRAPIVVLAGQVKGEPAIAGVTQVYALADHLGSIEQAMANAYDGLADLAERVAINWRQDRA